MSSVWPTARTCLAWGPLFILPVIVWFSLPTDVPRWGVTLGLFLALFVGAKWLSWRDACFIHAPAWKHVAYLLAWIGMDARAFLRKPTRPVTPAPREWLEATAKLIGGAVLIWIFAPRVRHYGEYLSGLFDMTGLGLMLLWGMPQLTSCVWRSAGIDARPLMNSPLLATSVTEFWGRRWNTAYRDLTHRFIFVPLAPKLGLPAAVFVGFAVSGVVHELITLSAQAGYGGPTVYFLIQPVAMFVERCRWGHRLGLGRGLVGWCFTAVVLLAPINLLFPPACVYEVVVPFCRFLTVG